MAIPTPAEAAIAAINRAVRYAYADGLAACKREAAADAASAYFRGVQAGKRRSRSQIHDLEVQLEEAYTTIRCLTRTSA